MDILVVALDIGRYREKTEFFLEYDRNGEKIFWARDPFCSVRHFHREYSSREEAINPFHIGTVEGVPMRRTLHPTESLARFACRCGFQFIMSQEQLTEQDLRLYFQSKSD